MPRRSTYYGATASFAFLLDLFPGAGAAYSMRKLRSAYSGGSIRVRRDSDNAEQDIGFVANVLDTASLISFCTGANGYIVTGYDQSGNGRDLTQTTAIQQPKIYDSSTGLITTNSLPAWFWGTSPSSGVYMEFPQFIADDDPRSFFIVNDQFSSGSTGQDCLLSLNDQGAVGGRLGYRICKETSKIVLRVNGSASFNYPAGIGSTDYTLLSNTYASGGGAQDADFWLNGDSCQYSSGTTGVLRTNNNGTSFIGYYPPVSGGLYYTGTMQEIVIYDSDQSANRTGIESNINDFYSIW